MISMAKKETSPKARPYGRQADGKTIKSLSLEANVADWAEKEASRRGVSLSAFVNDVLKGNIKADFDSV